MYGLKTSFKTFRAPLRCKPTKSNKQQIKIKQGWIIRENLRKCLSCKGQARIVIRGNGKLARFYPANKPYPHEKGCENT